MGYNSSFMTQFKRHYFHWLLRSLSIIVIMTALQPLAFGQKNSVVQVHADKSSGYGVAWGGPQNQPDYIVTALHLVSGKSTIIVVWQGKKAYAEVEKIYKPADLALLKLKTPLGIPPLIIYSGDPPWDTNVNFWEVPINTTTMTGKFTVLDEKTSLAKISPRVANNPNGLSKALCSDANQFYPGMNTSVINFKEPNIRKSHSGSPLTYGDKILGMVDGGAKLVDGKACVWAIPASEFIKLFNQGTPLPASMQACDQPGSENKYMYSGMRSDNPLLSPEEAKQASKFEESVKLTAISGSPIELSHEYRMTFDEVYETLFEEEQNDLNDILASEEELSLDNLFNATVDLYIEENTGISILLPVDCKLYTTTDDYGTLITTSSPGGLVTMSIYISPNETMEEGMNALDNIKAFLEKKGQPINPEEDDIDDFRDDDFNPYYSEYVENTTEDENGDIQSEFFADLIISDGDVLAVTVNIADWSQLDNNADERLYLYLLQTCALLSDFTIY
jgi:hypothetical protein